MSVHQETMQALIEMGIEAPKARAAALRFTKTDAAVNWCFSDGMDWSEEEEQSRLHRAPATPAVPRPPLPEVTGPGTTVEHREVAQSHSDTSSTHTEHNVRSPPLPPRRGHATATAVKPLGDKNPFRTGTAPTTNFESNNPFAQQSGAGGAADPIKVEGGGQDDEDEDLRRALEMSREGLGTGMTMNTDMDVDEAGPALLEAEEDERDRQRRNVRVEGPPPPSPTLGPSSAQTGPPMFGPSTKTDMDNSMAMMPFDWDKKGNINNENSPPFPERSKEDQDMDKAIADSLMTASFHSAASAAQDAETRQQSTRPPGTPLVLYSQSGQGGSAGLLQGLLAIPRIRELLRDVLIAPDDSQVSAVADLRDIASKAGDLDRSFVEVDPIIRDLKERGDSGRELPPTAPVRNLLGRLHGVLDPLLRHSRDVQPEHWRQTGLPQPGQLFMSQITHEDGIGEQWAPFVQFVRQDDCHDLYGYMVNALWDNGKANIHIEQLPDIMTVYLSSSPDVKRKTWKLDREIVMDRFLARNMVWSVKARAAQSLAEGDVRRLKEKLSSYTTHEGQDIATSIKNTIQYYAAYPGKEDMEVQHRSEVKAKLESTLSKLEAKVADLQRELEAKEAQAHGGAFETDDPELQQEVYHLRALLYHDGALLGNGHLYMYMLGEQDQWWKIQDHEATPVDWSAIDSDDRGLYMDGGPYCLLYDRVSPRSKPFQPQDAQQTQTRTEEAPPDYAAGVQPDAHSQTSHTSTLVDTSLDPRSQSAAGQEPVGTLPSSSSQQPDLLGDDIDTEPETPTPTPRPRPVDHHRPLPKPPTTALPTKNNDDVDMS